MSNERIVVVDSGPEMQKLVDRLRSERYQVTTCPYDAKTLDCIRHVRPDVAVFSLNSSPGAPGLDIISIIKTDPTLSVTPIVMCTTPTQDIEQLVKELATMRLYVIHAPCSVDELVKAVEKAIDEAG